MKKNKTQKYVTEEQMEIKKFIFVLLGLLILLVGVYFFTRAFVTKDLHKSTNNDVNYTEGKVSYDVVVVGTMLNRPVSEYYVYAFSNEDTKAIYYNTLVSKYSTNEKALQVYYLDIDNALNKDYVDKSNASKSFTTINDLKLGELTLMKVKDGKVTKYMTNEEEIKKELGI